VKAIAVSEHITINFGGATFKGRGSILRNHKNRRTIGDLKEIIRKKEKP